jgi:hypothetical protein
MAVMLGARSGLGMLGGTGPRFAAAHGATADVVAPVEPASLFGLGLGKLQV